MISDLTVQVFHKVEELVPTGERVHSVVLRMSVKMYIYIDIFYLIVYLIIILQPNCVSRIKLFANLKYFSTFNSHVNKETTAPFF